MTDINQAMIMFVIVSYHFYGINVRMFIVLNSLEFDFMTNKDICNVPKHKY